MDKPIPEGVTSLQLMALIDWHGKDGTRKGELTTAALLELHQARLTAAQQQGQAVACVQLNPMRGKDDPHKIAYLDADLPVGTKLYAAPPSAPVGVEGLVERMRQAPSRLWMADLVGQQISVERMRDILTFALTQQPAAVDGYTTGHCERHKQPGGCDLHNLSCGWPSCDRRPAAQPGGSDNDR